LINNIIKAFGYIPAETILNHLYQKVN
jgi:hypothetical protein